MDRSRNHVYELFPKLADRRRQTASTMSGGEQQMLAIGRAMMNSPKLLMLDEPSLGLSPLMTQLVFEQLAKIGREGASILLVEQNASCLDIATRGLLLANGHTVFSGDHTMLRESTCSQGLYSWRRRAGEAPASQFLKFLKGGYHVSLNRSALETAIPAPCSSR